MLQVRQKGGYGKGERAGAELLLTRHRGFEGRELIAGDKGWIRVFASMGEIVL